MLLPSIFRQSIRRAEGEGEIMPNSNGWWRRPVREGIRGYSGKDLLFWRWWTSFPAWPQAEWWAYLCICWWIYIDYQHVLHVSVYIHACFIFLQMRREFKCVICLDEAAGTLMNTWPEWRRKLILFSQLESTSRPILEKLLSALETQNTSALPDGKCALSMHAHSLSLCMQSY